MHKLSACALTWFTTRRRHRRATVGCCVRGAASHRGGRCEAVATADAAVAAAAAAAAAILPPRITCGEAPHHFNRIVKLHWRSAVRCRGREGVLLHEVVVGRPGHFGVLSRPCLGLVSCCASAAAVSAGVCDNWGRGCTIFKLPHVQVAAFRSRPCHRTWTVASSSSEGCDSGSCRPFPPWSSRSPSGRRCCHSAGSSPTGPDRPHHAD